MKFTNKGQSLAWSKSSSPPETFSSETLLSGTGAQVQERGSAPSSSPKNPRSPKSKLMLRLLQGFGVALASIWLCVYLCFRAYYINIVGWLTPFSILLFVAELHTIVHSFGMLYSLWPRNYQTWPELNRSRDLQCNLFVCVCGEPVEVVRETALAALEAARVYQETINPLHPARVIMLNDGRVAKKDNWRDVEAMCVEIGITHIARTIPGGFKAGNINNGLKETPTSDPHNTLDIIFDSDFCAKPEFLVEITKPFVDNTIDWVQTPQRYENEKTWVAKAAAAHQIFFFDYVCPAKGYDNALFLCGTNFAIRRSALDMVGGIETEYITEDYATSLNLHAIGRKGVFMPKVIALGMAPTSLKQYFTQQRRWSKGSFDTSKGYLRELLFGKMTIKQKMHYLLSATYYMIGLRDLIMVMAPVPYLFFGISLIRANSLSFLLFIYLPMVVPNFILYLKLFRYPIKSLVLDVVSFPVFTSAFFQSLFGQKLGFVVTIKKYEKENPFAVYKAQTIVCVLLIAGLIYSATHYPYRGMGMAINYWWACFNATFLMIGFYLIAKENFSWGTWETKDQETLGARQRSLKNILRPKSKLATRKAAAMVTASVREPEVAIPSAAMARRFEAVAMRHPAAEPARTIPQTTEPATMTSALREPLVAIPPAAVATSEVFEPLVETTRMSQPATDFQQFSDPIAVAPQVDQPAVVVPWDDEPVAVAPEVVETAVFSPVSEPVVVTSQIDEPVVVTPEAFEPAPVTPDFDELVTVTPAVFEAPTMSPHVSEPVAVIPQVNDRFGDTPEVFEPAVMSPQEIEYVAVTLPSTDLSSPNVEEDGTEPVVIAGPQMENQDLETAPRPPSRPKPVRTEGKGPTTDTKKNFAERFNRTRKERESMFEEYKLPGRK
jgi:cellulose synthase/poly-beta-1,6-N-acetylglucosamine synthase-like glycosyltransferase